MDEAWRLVCLDCPELEEGRRREEREVGHGSGSQCNAEVKATNSGVKLSPLPPGIHHVIIT